MYILLPVSVTDYGHARALPSKKEFTIPILILFVINLRRMNDEVNAHVYNKISQNILSNALTILYTHT